MHFKHSTGVTSGLNSRQQLGKDGNRDNRRRFLQIKLFEGETNVLEERGDRT